MRGHGAMRRGRFVAAWVLMVAMVLTNVNYVKADTSSDIIASGNWRGMDWVIDGDGLLTVSGEYYKSDYDGDYPSWHNYNTLITQSIITAKEVRSTRAWFKGCKNLISVDLDNLNTDKVFNMEGMFDGCSQLTNIEMGGFNTSQVVNMDYMFRDCSQLKKLDLHNFNTENVTSMREMFAGCTELDNLDLGSFDTKKVKSMYWMFQGCSGLKNINISSFNTENVTIMNWMFADCSGLTNLDVSNFDTSNVVNMGGMFSGCSGLKQIDVSGFDTGKVTDMGGMFSDCSGIESIDINGWDTSNVTNMGAMFYGCSGIKSFNIVDIDTSNVTNMYRMFYNCSNMYDLNIKNVDTRNVTSMGDMFEGCSKLKELDLSSFDANSVVSMAGMFVYCTDLESLDISNFNSPKLSNHSQVFGTPALKRVKVFKPILWSESGSTSITPMYLPKSPMYDAEGNEYKTFPTGLSESIWLYAENPAVVPEGQFRVYVKDYATNEPIPNTHIFVDDTDYDSAENGYITLSADPQDSTEHTIYASADGYIQKPYQQLQIKGGESYTFYLDKMVSPDAPEIGEFDMTSDQAIIAEVKKYTSDELYAQWMVIMNSGLSTEDKLKRLNELSHNNGLTDVREGIKYVSTIGSHRRDYLMLTANECYCAFNWWDWLSTTPKGKTARGLLYADGLLFNNELNKYLDFSTYVKEDYPEVGKCKAMLKEFMEVDKDKSWVSESSFSSKKIMKNMKNAAKLNGIIEDAEADEILDKMVKAKTNAEFEKYQNQFCKLLLREARTNQKVEADGKVELYLGCSGLSKALKYASPALSFITSSADDIIGVMNLETDAEMYEEYDEFLTAIYSDTDVSVPMRIAAYQLHDEIENGWENKMLSTLTNCMSFEKDLICLNASSTAFSEATATISLASFVSNIVVDTGDFVKQAAYTSSYAELSALYSLKLQEDRTAFKENPTAENAWQFYEDYNLLWRLRYKGEEQYLRMNEVKAFIFGKLKSVTYSYKEEVVNDTLDLLSTSKFELADSITVPESLQYLKKTVVECPVDVAVYAKDGTLIAELKDGQVSETVNEYGRFAVVYESYSGEYAKVICQSTNDNLDIRITSVANGLVDYKCADQNEDTVQTFDHLLVEKGDVISVADDQYVLVHSNGSKETQNTLVSIGEDYQKVESLVIKDTTAELPVGQEKAVEVTVLPNNATSKNVIWYSEDEEIAKVKNGVITGIAPGNTVIWVCSSDNAEIFEAIDINILEAIARKLGDINGDGEVNAKDRMYLARALAGWDGYTVPGIELADFNGDGEVNAKDRMYLARKLAGWEGYE